MPGLDFEKTFVKLSQEFSAMEIPVQFAEIDSWFYPKVESSTRLIKGRSPSSRA